MPLKIKSTVVKTQRPGKKICRKDATKQYQGKFSYLSEKTLGEEDFKQGGKSWQAFGGRKNGHKIFLPRTFTENKTSPNPGSGVVRALKLGSRLLYPKRSASHKDEEQA